jgi:signal recognition particle receptor subunit beta
MVVLNYTGEEINAKIVYYGPGLSGKTTNLEQLYGQMPADSKGQMVSMKTRTDRTLFFDFFPLELGDIQGYRTRLLLYTVPGQVYYNATRKLVLKGADAVVFVADSAPDKLQENIESLRNLEDNLNEHGLSLDTIPWVIQYNKRDVPDRMEVAELHQHLNLMDVPAFEAIALSGFGVYDTFKSVAGMLYRRLKERLESGEGIPAQAAAGQESTVPASPGGQGVELEDAVDSALRELPGAKPAAPKAAPPPQPEPVPVPIPSAPAPTPKTAPRKAAAKPTAKKKARKTPAPPQPQPQPQKQKQKQSPPPTPSQPHAKPLPTEAYGAGPEPRPEREAPSLGTKFPDASPEVGRLVELDEAVDNGAVREEPPEFITDPMQRGPVDDMAQIESEEATVVTERKIDAVEEELTIPVVISRSQVRKTVPLKLRLEIRVVDD